MEIVNMFLRSERQRDMREAMSVLIKRGGFEVL